MPENRFYINLPTFEELDEVTIDGDELRHLIVMRTNVDEMVELINGHGELALARVSKVDRKRASAKIEQVQKEPPAARQKILAQAYPKFNRLELIVEKATELGIDSFYFFPAERSEKKSLTDQQQNRLHQLTIAASKQCGRLYLPQFLFDKNQLPAKAKQYFGELEAKEHFLHEHFLHEKPSHEAVIFYIGPESGFSKKEKEQLEKAGAKGVVLHKNTLRVDTAAIFAAGLMSI